MSVSVATLLTFQLTIGAQVLTVPNGAIIATPRLYVNVDCLVTVVPCASIPLTDRVLVPRDAGRGISLPLFAQTAVEDDTKLSYE